MKLIKCHIDNFGRFHDFDMEFSEGMNVIMEQNGWGKTTLTAFLKAMLYGFDRKSVKDVTLNERLRYKPWQGGTYGGSLSFEVNGKAYTVTRTFGSIGSNDTVKVSDLHSGRICRDFGDNIGEAIFKLDAAAFKRSVFVTQNSLGNTDASSGIHARLNRVLGEASDIAQYDDAIKSITERIKFYDKRGSNGHIAVMSRQIDELMTKIRAAKDAIAQVEMKRSRIAQIDDELRLLDRRIADYTQKISALESRTKDVAAVRKVYDQLCAQRENLRAELQSLTPPSAYPTLDEIEEMRGTLRQLEQRLEEVKQPTKELENLEKTIANIRSKYPDTVPTAKDLQEIRALRAQLDKLLSEAELDRTHQLDERIATLRLEIEKAESKERENASIRQQYAELCKHRDDLAEQCAAMDAELEGQPTAQILQKLQKKLDQIAQLASEIDDLKEQLSVPKKKLEELKTLYPYGMPSEGAIADAIALEAETSAMEKKLIISPDEQVRRNAALTRKTELASIFSAAVPVVSVLEQYRDQLNGVSAAEHRLNQAKTDLAVAESRVMQTREEKNRIANAPAPIKPNAAKASSGIAVLWFVLAAAAVACAVLVNPLVGAAALLFLLMGVLSISNARKKNQRNAEALSAYDATVHTREAELQSANTRCIEAEQEAARIQKNVTDCEAEVASVYQPILSYIRQWSAHVEASDALRECSRLIGMTEEWHRACETVAIAQAHEQETANCEEKKHLLAVMIAGYPYGESEMSFSTRMQSVQRDSLMHKQLEGEIAAAEAKLADQTQKLDAINAETQPALLQYGLNVDTIDEAKEKLSAKRVELAALRRQNTSAQKKAEQYAVLHADAITQQNNGVKTEKMKAEMALLEEARLQADDGVTDMASMQTIEDYEGLVDYVSKNAYTGTGYRKNISDCWKKLVKKSLLLPDAFASLDAMLQEADNDVAAFSKAEAALREKRTQVAGIEGRIHKLAQAVASFKRKYVIDQPDLNVALDTYTDAVSALRDTQTRFDDICAQILQYEKKNPELTSTVSLSTKDTPAELQDALQAAVGRRDDLRKERTQHEEGIHYSDRAVAAYRELEQQLNALVEQRQKAQKSLSILHKSAELLKNAKEHLADRYIGQISTYFNRYLSAIDQEGTMSGEVDAEFNVTMQHDGESHQARGYSTGYCDMIDLCMRLALIDTLFESERPFIIMDDPFVNLDAKHIEFAVSLLNRLAVETQIIYFACHPSRHTDLAVAMDFDIKKLQRTRNAPAITAPKMPVAPKEKYPLVAENALQPVDKRKITNNIFSLAFVADDQDGTAKEFEVFFVDETERILCDRIQVSVSNGQVIPEKVRFCLNTGSAHGNTYMLMIRNMARAENEVASKIPFDVSLTFASDFDF